VLRVPTTRGDVYLKAAAESPLFANEATVVPALAELFPVGYRAAGRGQYAALAGATDHGTEIGRHETNWSAPTEVREG
jgi:hypothetical protein